MSERGAGRPARVISVGRNSAWIAFEDSESILHATLPKSLERLTLVPGDLVVARPLDDDRALVERREPRTFALERTTVGGHTKTMAANVDTIAVVAAFERPPLHLAMVDELLAFAELHEKRALLFFTKADLALATVVGAVRELYRSLGYAVIVVNPKAGDGVEHVELELRGRQTLLIGQSGVGKSSLFRALGGTAAVGDVSKIGRGKQTTTTGRLYRTTGGFLIDSPGVGEFNLTGASVAQVADGFIEFRPYAGACRFRNCTHRTEPGCAISAAAGSGVIAASRYAAFRAILEREGTG